MLLVALTAPVAALAQNSDPVTAKAESTYPVSLERIRRGLVGASRTRGSRKGLKLEYYVEVYGRAPKIDLFTETENVKTSPVMYGGMTHQEFLNLVTPQEFRAPAADIPSAIAALIKWATQKKTKN